jgi:hypothetical protein
VWCVDAAGVVVGVADVGGCCVDVVVVDSVGCFWLVLLGLLAALVMVSTDD